MSATLLVVDDEPGVADALRELLAAEGFDVEVARNGRDGLEKAAARRPDVVLLDYMMPVMGGREVLHALRADPALRDVPVILMSAMPESSVPRDCAPTAFVRKPFDMDHLLAQIDRLLPAPTR